MKRMFSQISMTGTGLIILIVENLLRFIGVEFPEETIASAVNGLVTFVGFIFVIIGQIRRKDLKMGLVRKNPL